MGKNIWILHHYADPPDGHWTGTYDLYKFLVQKGHQVTVFSSSFSHYAREDNRLQPNESYKEQYFNSMRFVFIKSAPYFRNDWRRVLNMLTYSFRVFRVGCSKRELPDIIVGSTPHPFCALAALLLARRKKARFFLELHDLWLEYLVDTGTLSRRNPIAMGLKWLDGFLYKEAEKILILWPRMDKYLEQFGVSAEKIVWVPLGIDFDNLEKVDNRPRNCGETFVVMCTARFGPASNIYEILQAASILQNNGQNQIRFVLIGTGPEEEGLRQHACKYGLKNVEFRGLVPKREIRRHIAEADVCVGGLPDVPSYRKYGTIPTKLLDYMTSNRPTIFIRSSENSIVEKACAGLAVPPGNPQALAQAIIKLALMTPQERIRMGENGLKYIKENHNLETLAERLESLL